MVLTGKGTGTGRRYKADAALARVTDSRFGEWCGAPFVWAMPWAFDAGGLEIGGIGLSWWGKVGGTVPFDEEGGGGGAPRGGGGGGGGGGEKRGGGGGGGGGGGAGDGIGCCNAGCCKAGRCKRAAAKGPAAHGACCKQAPRDNDTRESKGASCKGDTEGVMLFLV